MRLYDNRRNLLILLFALVLWLIATGRASANEDSFDDALRSLRHNYDFVAQISEVDPVWGTWSTIMEYRDAALLVEVTSKGYKYQCIDCLKASLD